MSKLVTVMSFDYSANAAIAKSILESNGIECVLKNDTISSIYPLPQFSEIELQVLESQLEAAKSLLKEGGFLTDEN